MSAAASNGQDSSREQSAHISSLRTSNVLYSDDSMGMDGLHTQDAQRSVADKLFQVFSSTPCRRFCPPEGFLGRVLTRGVIALLVWSVLWSILEEEALPGGNIFSLFILMICASLGGFVVRKIPYVTLPSLLGMLVTGFLLRNVSKICIAKSIDPQWSRTLRSIALVVILLRSGLELDIGALRRLKFTVMRLSFGPCIIEAVTVAIAANLLLGMPWLWSFQLGFVLGAVTPAVIVPLMLNLEGQGYGTAQGIPTLVMAASSCDDVLAISLFGAFLGVAFSEGNIVFNIFRGPIELLLGVVFGILMGVINWLFPSSNESQVASSRFVILLSCGLFSLFGSKQAEFSGAGALGVLVMGLVAAQGWGQDGKGPIVEALSYMWELFEPLLFGLIGAEVSVEFMDSTLIGKALATLLIGLSIRVLCTYCLVFGSNFTVKEKIFICIAWLPKATVQAAIGSVALDTALERGYEGRYQEQLGIQIVTIAVMAILLTAPSGAIAITLTGPRLLRRSDKTQLSHSENIAETAIQPEPSVTLGAEPLRNGAPLQVNSSV